MPEQDDDLTVDDILGAEQTPEAARAEEGTHRVSSREPRGPLPAGADSSPAAPGASEESGAEAGDGETAPAEEVADSAEAENPYLEDLRRLSAEYANYRKRTEANAEIERRRAAAAAVTALLPVLDDIDRAEQHGDLEEGSAFATIAQKLRAALERLGLESFGEKGDPFDPQIHEAIAQVPVPGTESHTVLDVIERGYRIGDVELRPAKVAVAVGADG